MATTNTKPDAAMVAIADWVAAAQKADAYWKAIIAITKATTGKGS